MRVMGGGSISVAPNLRISAFILFNFFSSFFFFFTGGLGEISTHKTDIITPLCRAVAPESPAALQLIYSPA